MSCIENPFFKKEMSLSWMHWSVDIERENAATFDSAPILLSAVVVEAPESIKYDEWTSLQHTNYKRTVWEITNYCFFVVWLMGVWLHLNRDICNCSLKEVVISIKLWVFTGTIFLKQRFFECIYLILRYLIDLYLIRYISFTLLKIQIKALPFIDDIQWW